MNQLEVQSKKTVFATVLDFIRSEGAIVIFVTIFIIASIMIPGFFTATTFAGILKQASISIIACLGLTFVLMTGGIDLSVGYVVGLAAYISGTVATFGIPAPICLLIGLLVGATVGLVNGLLVEYIAIPAFIITLGTGYIVYGIAMIISNGQSNTGLMENFLNLGRSKIFGMEAYFWYALVLVIICFVLLHVTVYGRKLCAFGYNQSATKLSGISVSKLNISVYVICGACASLAGTLMAMRVNHANPALGGGNFTFEAITGAVLGGVSLTGGKGTAYGAVIGMLTYKTIESAITMMGIDSYVSDAGLAIIILIAIVVNALKNRIMQ